MKKLLVTTWMAALTALVGCQQNDELLTNSETPTTGGKQITVSAHIQNGGGSRVALTETPDENQNPTVKVEWRKDANNPETFVLYQMEVPATASDDTSNDGGVAGGDAGSGDGGASVAVPITFTQVDGTNQFTGEVDENYSGTYEAVYGEGNLALQNGTLNQEECVYMVANGITDLTRPIEFKHQTAILKVAFKVDGTALNLSNISDIVMRNVTPLPGENSSTITITPAAQASGNDVYIFLPASSDYAAGHSFTFGVTTTDDNYYEATLTIPANMSIQKGKLYTATIKLEEAIPYLTFSAENEQKFVFGTFVDELYSKLEYSVGDDEWVTIPDDVYDNPIPFGGEKGDLRLRGKSPSGTTNGENDYSTNYSTISFTDNNIPVACTGDIRTLVDWENYASANTENAKFYELFYGCTQLTSAPALPATNLADGCYSGMFYGCTQLTSAPELPANTLALNCYSNMFYGCTSLTTAPELPVTTLADGCYSRMFLSCISLNAAPALPATTLANSCYSGMFNGCTQLTSAPALPATTLKPNCYDGMFRGCISLTSAPELPATTLALSCYSGMFKDCISLESAPELPVTTLEQSCYSGMFSGCESLTSAPELPATILTQSCYQQMFYRCTQLTTAPVLPATTLADYCYINMFNGCTKLNNITMLATDISAISCLEKWVEGVAATGTFYKNPTATWTVTGASGIPEGWTVQNYTAPQP